MDNKRNKIKIKKAVNEFIKRDKEKLLLADIYEPTISHRIAVYLDELFPGSDVDCEYNKNMFSVKRDANGKNIRPDIIIHERLNNKANCVIMEIKKNGKDSKLAKYDIEKLKRCMEGTLNYDLGVFIGILKRRVDICWIENTNGDISESSETLKNQQLGQ